MKKGKKLFLLSLLLGISLVMAACGANPAETMYDHLEEAVALEAGFESQQKPLVEAEQKEHEIYEQIIELGISELEEIIALSDQAIQIVDERQEMMNIEKESIEAGYEEFVKIEEQIEKLEEEEVKQSALELLTIMENRYNSYQALFAEYEKALNLDRELYEMLKQEDANIDELQEQIDQINASYEIVVTLKDEFNEYTEQYNEQKREFYEKAELDVEYE
ncbi:YkyA family protein [Alkalihalobacillus sp. LMS39]|uniref:YkyA family protein n=1 Tax=Alkalihalobacillus sp. LMS39 TaxID=2924032 RepID=UPI001FB24E68|nr:YkyA family protein [Alkalihalobacillus sp. LMS39]UOE93004.1 YkyA family protein [Alkalihalobacillus sp. LMS39]